MTNTKIDYVLYSEILKAIGHPIRLRIVQGLLNDNKCNVNKIVATLELPQSTISQHLGVLRNRGVIAPRKEGVKTCYEVIHPLVVQIVRELK